MKTITQDKLTGFREPYETEKETLTTPTIKELKQEIRAINFMILFCYSITIAFLYNLVTTEISLTKQIAHIIIILTSLYTGYYFTKERKYKVCFIETLKKSNFTVLDCNISKITANGENPCDDLVYISTKDGQVCSNHFALNRKYTTCNPPVKHAKLLKCSYANKSYYKIFPDE